MHTDAPKYQRCAMADIDPLDQLLVENQLNHLRSQRGFKALNLRSIQPVVIPVYIHVLAKDQTPAGGYAPDQQLRLRSTFQTTPMPP